MIYKIFILGPQGSGKGTQAELLSERLNIPNISVGQLLRDEIEKGTEIGKKVKEPVSRGELVDHSIVNQLVAERIKEPDCEQGYMFDGFPRMLIQVKFFEKTDKPSHVLEIVISDEEAVNRIAGRRVCTKCGDTYHIKFNPPQTQGKCDKCGGELKIREDDKPEAVRQRLKIYHQETQEVLDYYQQQGKLIKINGEQSIEKVKQDIFEKLGL